MAVTLTDIPIDDEMMRLIADSEHDDVETVRRALILYHELDNADQMLRECDLLGGGQE